MQIISSQERYPILYRTGQNLKNCESFVESDVWVGMSGMISFIITYSNFCYRQSDSWEWFQWAYSFWHCPFDKNNWLVSKALLCHSFDNLYGLKLLCFYFLLNFYVQENQWPEWNWSNFSTIEWYEKLENTVSRLPFIIHST